MVLLFNSVTHALTAEKLLKAQGLTFKVIPVPKAISSDCGICIRFDPGDESLIRDALRCRVEVESIVSL
jgi:hypothetical protein